MAYSKIYFLKQNNNKIWTTATLQFTMVAWTPWTKWAPWITINLATNTNSNPTCIMSINRISKKDNQMSLHVPVKSKLQFLIWILITLNARRWGNNTLSYLTHYQRMKVRTRPLNSMPISNIYCNYLLRELSPTLAA